MVVPFLKRLYLCVKEKKLHVLRRSIRIEVNPADPQ